MRHILPSCAAFAAILDNGSVVTWGDAALGADGSAVQEQLANVQCIQSFTGAFSATLGSGSVMTRAFLSMAALPGTAGEWAARPGRVAHLLHCLTGDLVVIWGDSACGGAGSAVQEQLRNEQHVQVSVSRSLDCLAMGALCPGAMLTMVRTPAPSRNSGGMHGASQYQFELLLHCLAMIMS
mgnify:CR=1 FL=1